MTNNTENKESSPYSRLAGLLSEGALFLITGPAGTGKSYTVKALVDVFQREKIRFAITSSTGVSATLIEGETINRFLGYGISSSPDDLEAVKKSFVFKKRIQEIKKLQVLVIDEVSLIKGDTIDLIDAILKYARGNDLPFGGVGILFTGDFLQLKPVIKREDNTKYAWAFQSEAWKSASISVLSLRKVYRQDNRDFVKILSKTRVGAVDNDTIEFYASRDISLNTKLLSDVGEAVKLVSTREEAKKINEENLARNKNERIEFRGSLFGNASTGEFTKLTQNLVVEEEFEIAVGARVMTLCNREDDDGKYQNGSLGVVDSIEKDGVVVSFDNGSVCLVKPFEWKREVDTHTKTKSVKEDGSPIYETSTRIYGFKQMPLALAYAITIHKSQGMTIDKVLIDCGRIFAENQFYVAVSRVKSPEGLFLRNFSRNKITTDKVAYDFYLKIKKEELRAKAERTGNSLS